jgi:hypothetical protein
MRRAYSGIGLNVGITERLRRESRHTLIRCADKISRPARPDHLTDNGRRIGKQLLQKTPAKVQTDQFWDDAVVFHWKSLATHLFRHYQLTRQSNRRFRTQNMERLADQSGGVSGSSSMNFPMGYMIGTWRFGLWRMSMATYRQPSETH